MQRREDGDGLSDSRFASDLQMLTNPPRFLMGIMRLLHGPLLTGRESLPCATAWRKHRHGGAMMRQSKIAACNTPMCRGMR